MDVMEAPLIALNVRLIMSQQQQMGLLVRPVPTAVSVPGEILLVRAVMFPASAVMKMSHLVFCVPSTMNPQAQVSAWSVLMDSTVLRETTAANLVMFLVMAVWGLQLPVSTAALTTNLHLPMILPVWLVYLATTVLLEIIPVQFVTYLAMAVTRLQQHANNAT